MAASTSSISGRLKFCGCGPDPAQRPVEALRSGEPRTRPSLPTRSSSAAIFLTAAWPPSCRNSSARCTCDGSSVFSRVSTDFLSRLLTAQPCSASQACRRAIWLTPVTALSVTSASSASISGAAVAASLRADAASAWSRQNPRLLTRASRHQTACSAGDSGCSARTTGARPRRQPCNRVRVAAAVRCRQTNESGSVLALARPPGLARLPASSDARQHLSGATARAYRQASPADRGGPVRTPWRACTAAVQAGLPASLSAVPAQLLYRHFERGVMRDRKPTWISPGFAEFRWNGVAWRPQLY